jgi:KaiC/GvpD/RAD55 family RecA-like ATPase
MFIQEITEQPLKGIALIYGPAAAGKTTACLEALRVKSVYISTNKNFNLERLRKLRPNAEEIIRELVLFEPSNLEELEKAVIAAAKLSSMTDLLVIDSLATHLRIAERKTANLALYRILKMLQNVQVPVLVTSEVYDYLRESRHEFVGGDMLRLACDTIIEFRGDIAAVKKHSVHAGREWGYRISDSGLEKI